MLAIDIDGLTKHFGPVHAVSGVRFQVRPGEIFGFMGHNGAGKTTTLRMLLGLCRPTEGAARVFGHDVVRETLSVRRITGFLPASYALPPEMTARRFLIYIAAMFGIQREEAAGRAETLLRRFELQGAADRRLGGLSTGMAQKVGVAQALINEPRLLVLDEPTSGLDPLGRHELLELLREMASERGTTVLFSSHILSDIEALCERIAVMHQGRLVASGDVAVLKEKYEASTMDNLYLAMVRRAA
jgi:ABC-2 type transport system ATP-binding protein